MGKLLFIAGLLLLSACAQSGVPYPKAAASLPKLHAGESRLYVYRDSIIGAAIQPSIFLDGIKIGDAVSRSFIVKTIKPGKHVLSVTTETETRYAFNARPHETVYIKTSASIGFFLNRLDFTLASPEQAQEDMTALFQQEYKPQDAN